MDFRHQGSPGEEIVSEHTYYTCVLLPKENDLKWCVLLSKTRNV